MSQKRSRREVKKPTKLKDYVASTTGTADGTMLCMHGYLAVLLSYMQLTGRSRLHTLCWSVGPTQLAMKRHFQCCHVVFVYTDLAPRNGPGLFIQTYCNLTNACYPSAQQTNHPLSTRTQNVTTQGQAFMVHATCWKFLNNVACIENYFLYTN